MPDDLDTHLAQLAHESLARHTAAVDAVADRVALVDRLSETSNTPLPSSSRRLAVAAAAVLVLAGVVGIAWAIGDEPPEQVARPPDSVVATPPRATTTSPGTNTPPAAPQPAVASPARVVAGETLTVTPAGAIQHSCRGVIAAVATSATAVDGQISDGRWVPDQPDASTATNPCVPETAGQPVTFAVPRNMPAGDYELCLGDALTPAGCADVTVLPPADHACWTVPMAPPGLVDGTPPGVAEIDEDGNARWGSPDAINTVRQLLGAEVDPEWMSSAPAGQTAARAKWEAVVVPVDDGATSMMSIYLQDIDSDCLRHYSVGPGLESNEMVAIAQAWVDALAGGLLPDTPSRSVPITLEYFGRRSGGPAVMVDRFASNSVDGAALSEAEVIAAFPDHVLPDGSIVRLELGPTDGRCENLPVSVRGPRVLGDGSAYVHPELTEARSIAVADSGLLVATRDVCPDGTQWGQAGTRLEVVAFRTTDPAASPVVVYTRDADPARIMYASGDTIYASGELHIDDVSSDGRYVAVRDTYNSEQSKWHILDLASPQALLSVASACQVPGDIVGPPRFLPDGRVVLARLCAAPDTSPEVDRPIGDGDVQIEAIDLNADDRAPAVVWHGSVPGLGADSYARTVDLSVATDGVDLWVLLTGNGGVEQTGQTFWLRGDKYGEITKAGYTTFGFDPSDLLVPWDIPPGGG